MIATVILIILIIGYLIYKNIKLQHKIEKLIQENEKINKLEIENNILKQYIAKPQQTQTNYYIYPNKDDQS